MDDVAFVQLVERLVAARVDSITALGSTGSYAYLNTQERRRVAHLAVEHADEIPVYVGIGALRTSQVLTHAESAQNAGAAGLLLAPVSYQPLTEDEVFELFRTVTAASSVPVPAVNITRAVQQGRHSEAAAESARLTPLWELFVQCGGSIRVVAAIAELLGLARPSCLPLPLQGLEAAQRARVAAVISELGLDH